MRLRLAPLAALVLATGACIDPLEAPDGRFGTVNVRTVGNGVDSYALVPEAAFYGETNTTIGSFVGDTCVIAAYSATQQGSFAQSLNAGDQVILNISGRTDSLRPIANSSIRYYTLGANGVIPFIPGDTLRVTVPGATPGYPAATAQLRTAEPFTHDPIGVPEANQDITVTWTPAPAPGSQMTVSLRYANSFSPGPLNEQAFCSFTDDGSGTIRADFLNGWRTALNDSRETRLNRLRTTEVLVDPRTRLAVISTFGRPLPSLVQ